MTIPPPTPRSPARIPASAPAVTINKRKSI